MRNKLLIGALAVFIAVGVLFNGMSQGVGEEVKTGLVLVAIMIFCVYMKKVTKREEEEKKAAQAELANMQIVKDEENEA